MRSTASVVRTSVVIAAAGLLLVAPVALAGFAGTDVFLPSVGQGPGQAGSHWNSTVWVYNPSATAANVQFALYLRDQVNATPDGTYNETIQPGDTVRFVDAISTLFGVEGFGALRVTSDQEVVVNGRIFSTSAGESEADSVGQFFAAVPVTFALSSGDSTTVVGVHQTDPQASSDYRYNFGLMEVGGGTATVKVTAYTGDGSQLGSKEYQLGAFQPMQKGVTDIAPGVDTENARLLVEVLSGTGKVIAFGSGLANQSNDPSTFEMQFSDALLGSGGLTLPYSGTGSSGGALFQVTNSGSGIAVRGDTTSGWSAVGGYSDTTTGVYGRTNSGSGIHGESESTGIGVRGDTTSGWAAVAGFSDTTTGVYGHSNGSYGVHAQSETGIALNAESTEGWAGRFGGKVRVRGWVSLMDGTDAVLDATETGYLVIGDEAGVNMVLDNNEIMARNNGATSILYLQQDGGDVYVNGAVVHSSDRRLKQDIQGLDLGLDAVLRLRPVSFEWANREDGRRLGFIAQEVQEVVGEVVYESENGMLGVAYESLVPVLVKAVQEQQAAIERLSGELAALRGQRVNP